jgi:hypothetical protein
MKLLSFIKWIFVQIGASLSHKNSMFRNTLKYETGYAFFIWCASTAITTIVVLMGLAVFSVLTETRPPFELLVIWVTSWVLYLIYTGFSLMYTAFEADRAQLFETIKNGK